MSAATTFREELTSVVPRPGPQRPTPPPLPSAPAILWTPREVALLRLDATVADLALRVEGRDSHWPWCIYRHGVRIASGTSPTHERALQAAEGAARRELAARGVR